MDQNTHINKPLNSKAISSPGVFFQPRLTVNQPNDVYEQEADTMADKVVRMGEPLLNRGAFFKPSNNAIQRKCQACEEEEKHVHRKENNESEVQGNNKLDSYVGTLGSLGQQMPESSRKFFEPRFGHDFSNVKIHTDSGATQSAQSINALAYTTGNNIVFNSGQYAPDTDSGKKLMAHELTHVIQQGNGIAPKIQRDPIPAAPAPAASCPVTCATPVTLLSDTRNCGSGSDFGSADMMGGPADPLKRAVILKVYNPLPDPDLLVKMTTGVDGIGTLGGTPGLAAAGNFYGGSGKAMNHTAGTPIGDAASNSNTFKNTADSVEEALHTIVTAMATDPAKNNCRSLSLTSSPIPQVNFPFPLNPFKGFKDNLMLKAVIGGTHGIEITLTSFTINCSTKTYEATFHYAICDNFGVDDASDLYSDSLAAFWVLQHMRAGHKPFVNNILLDKTVKKSF